MNAATLPTPAEVLPHAAPMVLLDEVISWQGDTVVCSVAITEQSLFLRAGRIRAAVLIEYMAQTIGVLAGLVSRAAGEGPRVGYLIGVREAVLEIDEVAIGDCLTVKAQRVFGDDQLGSFDVETHRNGEVVARASLTVYREPQ